MNNQSLSSGEQEFVDLEGRAGEVIPLPIASGSLGYDWQLDLPNGVERIQDGPPRPVNPSVRLGGVEGGYLQVTAQSGDYVIFARLARPWEQDRPVRIVRIHLHIF